MEKIKIEYVDPITPDPLGGILRDPETGEWIGMYKTETITREEFARRYPSAVKTKPKERV